MTWAWLLALYRALAARWKAPAPRSEELPPQPPQVPLPAPEPVKTAPTAYLWDTPEHAYHSVRVLCDEARLTLEQKNVICACIYQESGFKNGAINHNTDSHGHIRSTDWGIIQINDHYHIGPGKDFPSVEYVLQRPEIVVAWMIGLFKAGKLNLWVSYSSGAYKAWLASNSPMWKLSTPPAQTDLAA